MSLGYPQTDGFAFDFGRMEFDLAAKVYDRLSNMKTSQPIEEGIIMGTRPKPITRTRGQQKIGDGSFEMEFEQALSMLDELGDNWGEAIFSISTTYKRKSDGKVLKIECFGCRLLDAEIDHSAGAEGLPAVFPFSFMRRKINGKEALSD